MSHLSLKQVEDCYNNGKKIDWHDQFEREMWRDAIGPLTIIGVNNFDYQCVVEPTDCDSVEYKSIQCGFIRYLCGNPNCRSCTDKSLILKGHFKIIRPDGLDTYGKILYKETKKKTLMNVIEQPVFKEH